MLTCPVCGNPKPPLARTCYRHTDREPIFVLLDLLIRAGLGSRPQTQITREMVLAACRGHVFPFDEAAKTLPDHRPDCPRCGKPTPSGNGRNSAGSQQWLCRGCAYQWLTSRRLAGAA